MTVECTQEEYCNFLLIPAGCNVLAGTDALEYALGFPGWLQPYDNVFRWSQQQLHKTWSITTMKHVNVASLATCTDTSQWRCHSCSCGTRAVENPTRYRKRTRTIPTEGSVFASWRSIASIPLLAKCAYVSDRSSSTFISLLWRFGPYSSHDPPPQFTSSNSVHFFLPPTSSSVYGGRGLHSSVCCPPACCMVFVLANFLRNFLLNSTL
jgi:hypothetical protein